MNKIDFPLEKLPHIFNPRMPLRDILLIIGNELIPGRKTVKIDYIGILNVTKHLASEKTSVHSYPFNISHIAHYTKTLAYAVCPGIQVMKNIVNIILH